LRARVFILQLIQKHARGATKEWPQYRVAFSRISRLRGGRKVAENSATCARLNCPLQRDTLRPPFDPQREDYYYVRFGVTSSTGDAAGTLVAFFDPVGETRSQARMQLIRE
jgi:hypothetical protein